MYPTTEIRPNVYSIEDGSVRMYLICGKERALLLDTGFGSGDLIGCLKDLYSGPIILAHTHAHFDHVGGDRFFQEIYAHPDDWDDVIGQGGVPKSALKPLREGDVLQLGGRELTVYETPGHTKGTLSFLDKENRLFFTGDNVSDVTVYVCMPGADLDQYESSIRRILSMRDEYDIMLGCHGTAEQPVSQAERMLDCVQAIRDKTAVFERYNAYDDFYFLRASIEGASIYLPLPASE